jgi:hypothetical protein
MTNAPQLVVNFGGSVRFFDYVTLSLLGEANVKVANAYEKGYTAGLGATFHALVQEKSYSMLATYSAVSFQAGEENQHREFDLSLAYHLTFDDSVRLTAKRIKDYDMYRTDMLIAYHRYF